MKIWQKGINLTKEVYLLAKKLPNEEKFGLYSQLTRSAVSVPSNIAEGHRRGDKEFLQFLTIASGSLAELETQLAIVDDVYSLDTSLLISNCDELNKMIYSFKKALLKADS